MNSFSLNATLKTQEELEREHGARPVGEGFSKPLSFLRQDLVRRAREKIPVATYESGKPPPDNGNEYDCSGLTAAMIKETMGYDPFSERYTTTEFKADLANYTVDCNDAQPGDIIMWKGHIGIIADPANKTFVAAQGEKIGLQEASFADGKYWSKGKTCYNNKYLVGT